MADAAQRLAPILEWLNTDAGAETERASRRRDYVPRMQRREVTQRVREFLVTFDGSDEQVRLGKNLGWGPLKRKWPVTPPTPEGRQELRLLDLRFALLTFLRDGALVALPSLRFRAEVAELVVSGSTQDLVLYLAGRLVADHFLLLKECAAPASDDPGEHCGTLLVRRGAPGPARRFCSEACKKRVQRARRK